MRERGALLAWLLGALALAATGCEAVPQPPPPPPPLDACAGLPPLVLTVVPARVHVGGAALLTAQGGSGRHGFRLSTNASGGAVVGDRYAAGPFAGTDVVTVEDDCQAAATATVEVSAPFDVQPVAAAVAPGRQLTFAVQGNLGAVAFAALSPPLASGGTVSAGGDYTAGPAAGTDVLVARDGATGEQVLVRVAVSPTAAFRARPPLLALPPGASVPLGTSDGSGVVDWAVTGGGGTVSGGVYTAPWASGGTATVVGTDRFFPQDVVTVKVRVLTELTRPTLRPQGRRSDVASLATGDFDGDGFLDVALGVPESDLRRPQGGAVFIFMGSAAGLAPAPTWTISGDTDTAQLGAVLAAGDLDGDGRDDLAISAPGADVTVSDSGAVLLYRLASAGPELIRPALTGLGRGNFGSALAIADVDGDGAADLVVGSPGADLSGVGFSARGVLDVFLVQRGHPIGDLGTVRLGGADLSDAGVLKATSNLRAGRAVVAADLNGDGVVDLAFLSAVNNSLLGGTPSPRNQVAVQVHFARAGARRFEDAPDLFVLPANPADPGEGTWRLGFVPREGAQPPLLLAAADATDSPNLSADGGAAGGANAGGALLFDLTAFRPTAPPTSAPGQVGRDDAWARVYGDQAGIATGRSFAVADVDLDGHQDLVLGAPYAGAVQPTDAGATNVPLAGKLLVFRMQALGAGAVVNKPDGFRAGQHRTDTLGIAVASWGPALVAYAGRASTSLGDFTGRLDTFAGQGDLSSWSVSSAELPAAVANQGFGTGVDLAVLGGATRVLVGAPGFSGPASDLSGNEVGAGQALGFAAAAADAGLVLAEGANTPYAAPSGVRAFGGRALGSDVAFTDFDGDGRPDAVIAAPNFTLPVMLADGGTTVTEYAVNRPACMPSGTETTGAALVQLGQADGSFKEAFRVWARQSIAGCSMPDGGTAACRRTALGRAGLVGDLDFDGDGRQDLAVSRANGLEVFPGRSPDDASLTKPTMACEPLFSFPFLAAATSAPAALGDVDGDGCDEVGFRYSDSGNRQGFVVLFGFDAAGVRCGGHAQASWLRVSGDSETGLPTLRLGVSMARVGTVTAASTDFVAVTADFYPWQGTGQAAVLLYDVAQLAAKRPASGEALVGALADGLTPVPVLSRDSTLGFGRAVWGGVDATGDGRPDLFVSATGASVNGAGTGAVFVFAGGTVAAGPNEPQLVVVGDGRERAAFGQDLAVRPASGGQPAALVVGAPLSYRSGTANGTAFVLPLDL